MKHLENYGNLIGRILLSGIFLMSGLGKISGYAETQGYMEAMGVPGELLPLAIAVEVIGAIAVIVGYKTRFFAFLLAGFSVVSAFLFHGDFNDQVQSIMFMKNITIAGGFMLLVTNGAGNFSFDQRQAAA